MIQYGNSLSLALSVIVVLVCYVPVANASIITSPQNFTNNIHLSFSFSNATNILPPEKNPLLSIPDPTLSNVEKQTMIDEVMNLPGVKAWSNNWKFETMDFIGTYSPTVSWQYAVVRLYLLPSDDAASHCAYGWGAVAKIDLTTKEIVYVRYPTNDKDNICNVVTLGPLHHNSMSPMMSWFFPLAYAATSPPDYESFATVEQYDVSTSHWYGNKALLVPPVYSQSIFTDMNQNSDISQTLNADWNTSCSLGLGTTPDCLTQAGWIIINYPCGSQCHFLTANTEDLVYVDQSMTGSYTPQNTLLNVLSGYTETTQITCNTSTSKQQITILYNYQNQMFHHDTTIPCTVYQTSDTFHNSVFLENYNEGASANWAKDITSSINATAASEYNSQGSPQNWAGTSNLDGHAQNLSPGIIDSGSLVLTGYLAGGNTATWSNLGSMPPYASPCTPQNGWTISVSCILASSTSVSGDVTVQTGKVLIIPSGITLTMPFTTHKLSINLGGAVLIEPGGKISS